MIARLWRGITRSEKSDEYLEYLKKTGVREIQRTEGNRGVYVLRRITKDQAEFLFISLWDSMEAIQRFAGNNPQKAVYYPEDAEFLKEMTPEVEHFEVAVQPE